MDTGLLKDPIVVIGLALVIVLYVVRLLREEQRAKSLAVALLGAEARSGPDTSHCSADVERALASLALAVTALTEIQRQLVRQNEEHGHMLQDIKDMVRG